MSASASLTRKTVIDPGTKPKRATARSGPVKKVRESPTAEIKTTRNGARRTAKVVSRRKARTSQILRDILTNNPDDTEFTVEQIVNSIGESSFGTSLMFFAIPEVVPIPVPGLAAIVVIPTAVISAQLASGQKQIRLPKFILKKTVPRRALAAAIHAILPLLEKAEKVAKPRWKWAKRLLGVFIFILALSIAFPIPGFNMPQAISTFIIALGLAEDDGMLIAAGVLGGLVSLAILGGAVFGVFSLFGFGFGGKS
jgi:hypothetical protein